MLLESLLKYRDTGFSDALSKVRGSCENMNVEAVLVQKRIQSSKRQFSYEAADETVNDAVKRMEVTFIDGEETDLDRQELTTEIQSLPNLPKANMTASQKTRRPKF